MPPKSATAQNKKRNATRDLEPGTGRGSTKAARRAQGDAPSALDGGCTCFSFSLNSLF